jgi:hypothetical protein
LNGVGDLGRLACEVEVLADPLLGRGAPAESIVIEGIVGFVELIAQAIIGVLKIDATEYN